MKTHATFSFSASIRKRRRHGTRQESSRLIELKPRLLVLFLFIAIPFILIGCLLILGFVRGEMKETVGRNLYGAAADTARYLDSYVLHTLTHVWVLATTPTLRQTVVSSNRNYRN